MTALRRISSSGTGYGGRDDDGFLLYRRSRPDDFRSSAPTTSTLVDMLQQETAAERNIAAVRSSRFITQLGQIKMITGYSWDKIANLLSCTRQSLYNWRDGLVVTDMNIRAVQRMHDVLSHINQDNPVETRAVLEANDGAIFKLLKEGMFEVAKRRAGEGIGSGAIRRAGRVNELPGRQDHWTDRVAAGPEEVLGDNDGFEPTVLRRRGAPRKSNR
ncbi:hypothetical protein [Rhizobium sophoriradicis]|uniref:Uncharacterized protein n=1 Tax=Rhizobium sophoriradicis TaxID=1535245 RepID=A0A2A5KKW8_9HYPH|nr:hypothetical protein [Rhizobium sophoriradicis]PCK77690.1 hypothetical protein CPT34_28770 [Rhizobium sophoriradicis]